MLVSGRIFVGPFGERWFSCALFLWPGFDVIKVSLGVLVLREIAKSTVKNQARRWWQAVLAQNRSQDLWAKKSVWSLMFNHFFGEKTTWIFPQKLWKDSTLHSSLPLLGGCIIPPSKSHCFFNSKRLPHWVFQATTSSSWRFSPRDFRNIFSWNWKTTRLNLHRCFIRKNIWCSTFVASDLYANIYLYLKTGYGH